MAYPTISPCAMAPILHAASKRNSQLNSSGSHFMDYPKAGANSELGVYVTESYRSRPSKNMIELQQVSGSGADVGTLSDINSSVESHCHTSQNNRAAVPNYEHLVESSPTPSSTDDYVLIDHNVNNNWHLNNDYNECSTDRFGDYYNGNTCRCRRKASHLCNSTSLQRNFTDGNGQRYPTPTICYFHETGLGEMAEADQDINILSRHEIPNEGDLLDRQCSSDQEIYLSEDSISMLSYKNMSTTDDHIDEVHTTVDRKSSKISEIFTSASSVEEMKLQMLSDAETQSSRNTTDGLVEIGRCSIYFDPHTGRYHSTMFGSFPRDKHSLLNTLTDGSEYQKLTLDPNEDLAFPNAGSAGSSSLPNMPTHQLSFRRIIDLEASNCGSVFLKVDGVDRSDGNCRPESEDNFEGSISGHMAALSSQLSIPSCWNLSNGTEHIIPSRGQQAIPGHRMLGKDSDSVDQLVHTYPGSETYKHKAIFTSRAQVTSCDCCPMKEACAPTSCADKCGAFVHGSRARVPSLFVADDDDLCTTQATKSPAHISFTASAKTDDEANKIIKKINSQRYPLSHMRETCSTVTGNREQSLSKLSTKPNMTSFSVSSFFTNLFSGKSRDMSRTNEDACGRKEQDFNHDSRSQSQNPQTTASDNERYCYGRGVSNQTEAAHSRQCSPSDSYGDVCQDTNNSPGIKEQACETLAKPDEKNSDDQNSEEKTKLRTSREMTRNYVAYLCCPADALATFGLPFYKLLESWGLPIFIPERNLPLSGSKYENMAECVEERCNGKVIVILSNTYANSEECLFVTYFAKTLDPDSRHRNIIPVLIDADVEIPSVLRGLSLIKYNHLARAGWLKEKLVNAIAA